MLIATADCKDVQPDKCNAAGVNACQKGSDLYESLMKDNCKRTCGLCG